MDVRLVGSVDKGETSQSTSTLLISVLSTSAAWVLVFLFFLYFCFFVKYRFRKTYKSLVSGLELAHKRVHNWVLAPLRHASKPNKDISSLSEWVAATVNCKVTSFSAL
jgi:hypothetical protein